MKLEIISGQPGIEESQMCKLFAEENISDIETKSMLHFLRFPERTIFHPKKLYDEIRRIVKDYIKADRDLFIFTYSDHVLNAVRVEINKHHFVGAKCHQFLANGDDKCADITPEGGLTYWAEDIFDVWENALDDLLAGEMELSKELWQK